MHFTPVPTVALVLLVLLMLLMLLMLVVVVLLLVVVLVVLVVTRGSNIHLVSWVSTCAGRTRRRALVETSCLLQLTSPS
jgi:hypothetical protein